MVRGSMVAIITPFNEDLSINYPKLEELLHWHVQEGTAGIIILGTTGEASTLSQEEKLTVFEFTVKVIAGRIPVIAGTGSNNTLQTIAFSKQVDALGVDGFLIVTPYYNKANNKGFITHYTMIADAVSKPVIIYNVPSRTGVMLPASVVASLSTHPNIVGIKEASGDLSYVALVASLCPRDFLIYSGNDDIVLPVLALGGAGVISVAANVIPREFATMVKLYLEGKTKEALDLQLHYLEYINNLFIETNPIPVKEYMNQLQMNVGLYRLPLCEMEESNKTIVKNMIQRFHQ